MLIFLCLKIIDISNDYWTRPICLQKILHLVLKFAIWNNNSIIDVIVYLHTFHRSVILYYNDSFISSSLFSLLLNKSQTSFQQGLAPLFAILRMSFFHKDKIFCCVFKYCDCEIKD